MDHFHSDPYMEGPSHETYGISGTYPQQGFVVQPGGLSLNFGNVAIGRYRKKRFHFYNSSPLSQTFYVTKFPIPDSGFKWLHPNLPITIQPFAHFLIPIKFTPIDLGNSLEVVHLQNYDGTLKISICLSGTGYFSRNLIPHGQMWTLYDREQVDAAKLRAATVIQRWWRRRLMRHCVTKKWNQLVEDSKKREETAASLIQQSWKSFLARRKNEERSSNAVRVIENAVRYHMVRRKWIQSLDQLRARKSLEKLIKSNESKSPMMTLKVFLHGENHLQRLESSISNGIPVTDEDKNLFMILKMKRAVQVLESFFKYTVIRNKWLEVIKQASKFNHDQQILEEKMTGSAIRIQRCIRSHRIRRKWIQVVNSVMEFEKRRKEIVAMSQGSTAVTVLGGMAIVFLVYLLTC